jgi:nicotinamide-nucleotide amidase
MNAAILTIGTELTRGELADSNGAWLAEALTSLGFEVTELGTVDDDRARIEAILRRLGAEHDVLVCTGGLGPTTDDLTTECVARVLGVGLHRDTASLEAIRERLSRFGRRMAESNAKQADFPEGAEILPNLEGTAPGFAVALGRTRAFFTPGVPRELQAMFAAEIAPRLTGSNDCVQRQVRLRTYGKPESEVNDLLAGIEAKLGVTLGYRATFPEIEVKVLARAATATEAEATARRAAAEVRERLGDTVFGEGDATLAQALGELLSERGLSLALAESCTGGLIAELVTATPGSSAYFWGGLVSYANAAKTKLLGVPEELLAAHGAVSPEVARAMAEGARRAFATDLALAVTGIAGPSGGSADKPVGLVHFALATKQETIQLERRFPGRRELVRRFAAFAGLALVRRAVLDGRA